MNTNTALDTLSQCPICKAEYHDFTKEDFRFPSIILKYKCGMCITLTEGLSNRYYISKVYSHSIESYKKTLKDKINICSRGYCPSCFKQYSYNHWDDAAMRNCRCDSIINKKYKINISLNIQQVSDDK